MERFDLRVVKVTIDINGTATTYENLAITAQGTKYANALQNECTVTIANLKKETQDYLLTETSPFNLNQSPKTITVEAGRQSYGTKVIFRGNIIRSSLTQPPDVTIKLNCLTGNFIKGNVLAKSQPSNVQLSVVSKQIAQDLNTVLNFQASDKNLSNFSFNGSSAKQVNNLAFVGGVNVFVDDNTLVVKDMGVPLQNVETVVNAGTGMVGIPEITEQGVRVKFLLDANTRVGGLIKVTSTENPSVNGDYVVYKLAFDIANRDEPFYYIADGARRR